MRANLAWPAGHRDLYDALKDAGIDADDLLSVRTFPDACRIINERLSAAGCDDLPREGEDLRDSIERVKRWAARVSPHATGVFTWP